MILHIRKYWKKISFLPVLDGGGGVFETRGKNNFFCLQWARKKFEREKKWRVEMIRTTLPGCALVDKISYGFWCFRLRSSKWDSLPACLPHVLMKSEHIPANQCIPLQASVHIVVYHCITRTIFDQFDWGFQFWICLSVCLSVSQPASQPACLLACLPACLYMFFFFFFF